MIKVFIAAGRFAPRREGVRIGLIALLAAAWLAGGAAALAQQQPDAKSAPPGGATADPKAEAPAEDEAKPDVDPSATHKAATLEVFKDPAVEGLLDPKKFSEIRASRAATNEEIALVKTIAANPVANVDVNAITSVVNDMVGRMTSTRNIQAVLDPASEKNPTVVKAIQEAAQNLREPIFSSRATKNTQFQAKYNQILLQKLQPLLKHHLIPRIQAMILLAQSANPDALKVFLDEIKNPQQTVWVKLWAFQGVTLIKTLTNRLTAAQESDAAKVIADQLLKGKDWPAWVQFRALESLTALRQGFLPASPRTADMASAAFQYLIDDTLSPEVRAQAALALGSMQITTAVPKFNFDVVGYGAAQVGAVALQKIVDAHSENPTRAQQLTTILAGPLLQAFEGQEGVRDSGLLNNAAVANKAELTKYRDALKSVVKSAAVLSGAPSGQYEALRNDLKGKVDAYKALLAKSAPADLLLFPGGPTYAAPGGQAAPPQAAAGSQP